MRTGEASSPCSAPVCRPALASRGRRPHADASRRCRCRADARLRMAVAGRTSGFVRLAPPSRADRPPGSVAGFAMARLRPAWAAALSDRTRLRASARVARKHDRAGEQQGYCNLGHAGLPRWGALKPAWLKSRVSWRDDRSARSATALPGSIKLSAQVAGCRDSRFAPCAAIAKSRRVPHAATESDHARGNGETVVEDIKRSVGLLRRHL